MALKEYARKRNFSATPEPAKGSGRGKGIFVVQLHHASHRHFDFRLELNGVLKSWAIPKGPSFDPAVKRLAVEVEDHPLAYANFEGHIPKGNYGAGRVDVFDQGTWEPIGNARQGLEKGDLKFELHGDILRGSWVLVRTRKQGSKQQWLLIKHRDEYAGPRDADAFVHPRTDRPISVAQRKKIWKGVVEKSDVREAPTKMMPRTGKPEGSKPEVLRNKEFAPQLCKSQESPPLGDDWLHEIKWDGYRIVTSIVEGKVRLWSRNAIEWTHKVPELAAAVKTLNLKSAQLDGEMIVLREGRDDFNALQRRLSSQVEEPAIYMLFDMPHLNGLSLRDVALIDRKALLAELLKKHPHPLLRYSEHQIGNGKAVFAQATAAALEGVVSKRIDSGYSGSRNGDWVKAKGRPSDEFVVVGYTEPKGNRSGIGALLLAKPLDGKLVYVGRVGTGFSDEQLRALRKQLAAIIVDKSTADAALMKHKDRALAIWVKPRIVVEVFYQGIGGKGLMRQVAFKTIRGDKNPSDLLRNASKPKPRSPPSTYAKTAAEPRVQRRSSTQSARVDATAVVITHPGREVFPGTGITKGDVADYYRAVSTRLVPEISGRPLSVVRCPGGSGKPCFFQKHLAAGWGKHIRGVTVKEKTSRAKYLCIDDDTGMLELVQMNVLEFHPWGAIATDPDHADRIVFDLDPHPTVRWPCVTAAARDLRGQLESIGLKSFLRTSGGKGLHVVVPLNPPAPWKAVKAFAQAVAEAMATLKPKEFVSVAGEKNRKGKIFVDWLRNGRGATSIASYSLRARTSAGVAMPIAWGELGRVKSGDNYTIKNALKKIRNRRNDPWEEIATAKQSLPALECPLFHAIAEHAPAAR